MDSKTVWHKLIPWYMTIICTVCLLLVTWYLYQNIQWFKTSAVDDPELLKDGRYRIFIYNTHLSIVQRSLGILTGVSISFIGLGTSLFALEKSSDLDISGFAKLTTFSPGILAILLGGFLISQAVSSKDTIQFAPSKDNTVQQPEQANEPVDSLSNPRK